MLIMHIKASMWRRSDADCAQTTCARGTYLVQSHVYSYPTYPSNTVIFRFIHILYALVCYLRCICPTCTTLHFVPGRHLLDGDAGIRHLVVQGHRDGPSSRGRAIVSHESHSDFLYLLGPRLIFFSVLPYVF